MTRALHWLAMAALPLLASCGHSPQTHLLTLDMAPPAARASYAGPPVRLTAVQIPSAIDRLEYVSAVSPNELRVQDQYRWSASLGSLARGALLRDLAERLPTGAVLPPDSPATKGTRRVDVAILALTQTAERSSMDVIITVAVDGGPQVLRHQVTVTRDHPPRLTPAEAAGDTSYLLGQVADEITVLLGQMKAPA